MLPPAMRMRSAEEYRATVRGGVRAGRGSVVVHAAPSPTPGPRVGLVVSKAVGNAVARNRVKRRLRHLAAGHLGDGRTGVTPSASRWVIRALPGSATAGQAMATDLDQAWQACLRKLTR